MIGLDTWNRPDGFPRRVKRAHYFYVVFFFFFHSLLSIHLLLVHIRKDVSAGKMRRKNPMAFYINIYIQYTFQTKSATKGGWKRGEAVGGSN